MRLFLTTLLGGKMRYSRGQARVLDTEAPRRTAPKRNLWKRTVYGKESHRKGKRTVAGDNQPKKIADDRERCLGRAGKKFLATETPCVLYFTAQKRTRPFRQAGPVSDWALKGMYVHSL